MSNIKDLYSPNGTRNPDIPRKPRKYTSNDAPAPEIKPLPTIFRGIPQTNCKRFDSIVNQVKEFNAAMATVHLQDQRYSPELLALLAFEFNQIHGERG